MDISDRGMNPVAMTIINPCGEYWPSQGSNQQPCVLKSSMSLTELCSSAPYDSDQLIHVWTKYIQH